MCFKYALTAVKMAASTHRKHSCSIARKQVEHILNRLAKGEKATKVPGEFGIGNSTVTDLKKNESRIQLFVSSMESLSVCSKECTIVRLGDDEKVDEAVYKLIFHISENFTNSVGPSHFGYERIHCTMYGLVIIGSESLSNYNMAILFLAIVVLMNGKYSSYHSCNVLSYM